jgi:uncharacterized protein
VLKTALPDPQKGIRFTILFPVKPYTPSMADDPTEDRAMIEIELGRVVVREHAITAPQYIYLREVGGPRSFPIVIGYPEAAEIQRLITGAQTERPMTHQLLFDMMRSLGAHLARVDITDIRQNTFYAQLVLSGEEGETVAIIDSRPSDSIALALRAGCPLRVAEEVLEQVRTDEGDDREEPPEDDPPGGGTPEF